MGNWYTKINYNNYNSGSETLKSHRNTIFEECAEVISQQELAAQQFIITLHAPKCAQRARAGNLSLIHI